MSLRLSYSSISAYSLCGNRYKHRYLNNYREKWFRASLCFGSAMDDALNILLEKKDLQLAKVVFDKKWAFQYLNNVHSALKYNPNIVYSASDLDLDLISITEEQEIWIKEFRELKSQHKWEELSEDDRKEYNSFCWQSMSAKGHVILDSYFNKVIPQLSEVLAIQYQAELKNSAGDSVIQYLDFVAVLKDGSVVLFDNKTTSDLKYFPDDAPSMSQQLISYYYNCKENFNLEAVGYVAIQKNLIKNKTKNCSVCKFDGTGGRHKTCSNEIEGRRCGGEWVETISPEAVIKIIVNPVPEAAQDLVLESFDEATNGIKNGVWYKNLMACNNIFGSPCEFKKLCWKGSEEDLIKIEKKTE